MNILYRVGLQNRNKIITWGSFLLFITTALMFFPPEIGIALTISILLHEIGHQVYLNKYGVKNHLVFIPLMGAMAVPDEPGKFAQLDNLKLSMAVMAGPAINAILMLIGILFMQISRFHFWVSLAVVNATLCMFNLLAIGFFTDGGKFTKALFGSLTNIDDRKFFGIMALVTALAGCGLIALGKIPYVFAINLFLWNVESGKSDPREAYSWKAMPRGRAVTLFWVYTVMLVISYWASLVLPPLIAGKG